MRRALAVVIVAGILLVLGAAPARPQCAGDCNADGAVTVTELETAVDALMGRVPVSACARADGGGDARVSVRDLVLAVLASRGPCAPADVSITITSPAPGQLFDEEDVDVAGSTTGPVRRVDCNGEPQGLQAGGFFGDVEVGEGSRSITCVALGPGDAVATSTVVVLVDTTDPTIVIESPVDGTETDQPTITVVGAVNDMATGVVNGGDVSVTCNGVAAEVVSRTFVVAALPVDEGRNSIECVAEDRAGNRGYSDEPDVFRASLAGQRIELVSGAEQVAPVGTVLAGPLVVRLRDGAGAPVANRLVRFRVSRGEGTLASVAETGRDLEVATDQDGLASVRITLGGRAGVANHRVSASSAGFAGLVEACFRAIAGPVAQVIAETMMPHRGPVGTTLPRKFTALVVDAEGNELEGVPVVFEVVEGGGTFGVATSLTVESTEDGVVAAAFTLGPREGDNVVTARVDGLDSLPATFHAMGLVPGLPVATRLTGVVLDGSERPIPNASVFVKDTDVASFTDDEGRFTLAAAPVGLVHLVVDGGTSTRPETFPHLEFEIVTIAGRENTVGIPIQLPALDVAGGADCEDGCELAMAGVAGMKLIVEEDSVDLPNGLPDDTHVMFSQVHLDRVPMAPPGGSLFVPAWTIQPAGAEFDPPARVELPNTGGLAPGSQTELYQFDHDLGAFISVGKATVSDDGATVRSDPGFGVTKAGWGGNRPPPPPPTTARGCGDCRRLPDRTCQCCGNSRLNRGEECDDGNMDNGDGCSSTCKLELKLEPFLVLGRGTCLGDPQLRLVEDSADVTSSPAVTWEWIGAGVPDSARQRLVDLLNTKVLGNTGIQIANLSVMPGGAVRILSDGVNLIRARKGGKSSNYAVVIAGMSLLEVDSLELRPYSIASSPAVAIQEALELSGIDVSVDAPLILFKDGACSFPLGDIGYVGVESLKLRLLGGLIADVDLVDVVAQLAEIAPLPVPIRALAELIGGFAVDQLIDYRLTGSPIVTVNNDFSLLTPPFLAGVVQAQAPGVTGISGTFDLPCVPGKAVDTVLTIVLPQLSDVSIRNEAGVHEDPLHVAVNGSRSPRATGFFDVLNSTHALVKRPTFSAGSIEEKIAKTIPGKLPIHRTLEFPIGTFLRPGQMYEGGDWYFKLGFGVTASPTEITVDVTELKLQAPLPNLLVDWYTVPAHGIVELGPVHALATRVVVEGAQPGSAFLGANACFFGPIRSDVVDVEVGGQCGDGVLQAGETCEPPGSLLPDGSLCRDCRSCGDGVADAPAEQCDDGNHADGDGCSATCRRETPCGDGMLDPGETCEPPGDLWPPTGNACRSTCTYCGDGIAQAGEQCDDGDTDEANACLSNCTLRPICGDGIRQPGEDCDDGNAVDGDGCEHDCTSTPVCGDGILQSGEICDDGNVVDGDGCQHDCTASPTCGDGIVQAGESCDPPGTACRAECTYCGDGVLQPWAEACDDGNALPGDGCEIDCSPTGLGPPDPGDLRISEVVTDPQRNWSAGTTPFGPTPGGGAADDGDEYVEIVNISTRPVSLQGVSVRMTDGTPATFTLGSGGPTVEAYFHPNVAGSSRLVFPPGAILVIGNPPGSMDDDVFIEVIDASTGLIADVEVGGLSPLTNFEADDDRDGQVDEDGPDGLDGDGDGAVDEDGSGGAYSADPVGDGAPCCPSGTGDATSVGNEAVRRSGTSGVDAADFIKSSGNPGVANP